MVYSKFTDTQDDNDETVLVSASANTPSSDITTKEDIGPFSNNSMQVSVETIHKATTVHTSTPTTCYTPYINRKHLKNLDISCLERNMQVRHDLMVEEGYRANLPKLDLAGHVENEYWEMIKVEVAGLEGKADAPRLRALLSEIREMMIELYPRCDVVTGEFAEFLNDTNFLIDQIKIGALDIPRFFQFLGNVMKKNCAPKRDQLVEAMILCSCPIEGLKVALQLIELMKIDLANFKLDQLKPMIAKTAVSTERTFFSQLFTNKKINLDLTTKWLSNSTVTSSTPHDMFLDAGIKLLVSPFIKDTSNVPETFILDKKRLIGLHGRFQDLCIVQCLLLIFKQSAGLANVKCCTANLLKVELLRLLEKPDTQISDISDCLIKSLIDCNVSSVDCKHIHSALNNIISPDNELFLLIECKLLKRIRSKLIGEDQTVSGFSELNVLDEFDELIKKFGVLLQYNWAVFEPVYTSLWNKEKQ